MNPSWFSFVRLSDWRDSMESIIVQIFFRSVKAECLEFLGCRRIVEVYVVPNKGETILIMRDWLGIPHLDLLINDVFNGKSIFWERYPLRKKRITECLCLFGVSQAVPKSCSPLIFGRYSGKLGSPDLSLTLTSASTKTSKKGQTLAALLFQSPPGVYKSPVLPKELLTAPLEPQ